MFKQFKNPNTGRIKEVKVGYSWTVALWGIIPMLCRCDWSSALFSLLIASMLNYICLFKASAIFYIIIGFYYNEYYANKLIKEGYIPIE